MSQIEPPPPASTRSDYLDLLEKVILNAVTPENGARIEYLVECLTSGKVAAQDRNALLHTLVNLHRTDPRASAALRDLYASGHWWTYTLGFPLSMIGPHRMRNIRLAAETVINDKIPGAMVETGVWRGGACMMMKGVMRALSDVRPLYVCDSFEGLPAVDTGPDKDLNLHEIPILSVPLDDVRSHFERLDLLDEHVHFVKGWFSETMADVKAATRDGIAVLRLDGDYYSSTMEVLQPLCPQVTPGGFVVIDDYYAFEQCQQAVDEYRAAHRIRSPLIDIDENGVYWRAGAV
ncbi:MAG TPA: TylF/MycF/NovP-related O-methyltransferase [Hyphomicrobiales bacterium]